MKRIKFFLREHNYDLEKCFRGMSDHNEDEKGMILQRVENWEIYEIQTKWRLHSINGFSKILIKLGHIKFENLKVLNLFCSNIGSIEPFEWMECPVL